MGVFCRLLTKNTPHLPVTMELPEDPRFVQPGWGLSLPQ